MVALAQISAIRGQKIIFVRGLLKEKPNMRFTDINGLVMSKFGSGLDGLKVKELKQEVDPSYIGKRMKTTSRVFPDSADGIEGLKKQLDAKKKIKATEIYRSMLKVGCTPSQAHAAVLDAAKVRPLIFDFTKDQLEVAKEHLAKCRKACFVLNRSGKVTLINPARVSIQDNRGKRKKDNGATRQN